VRDAGEFREENPSIDDVVVSGRKSDDGKAAVLGQHKCGKIWGICLRNHPYG
jgi:hypothetical protein